MYAGNSVVVNFLMRFPQAIPVAVVVGAVAVAQPEPVKVQTPLVPQVKAEVVVQPKAPLPPVEQLCPPKTSLTKKELAKLKPAERAALKSKGCIKG